ncbi:MAG: hypothetical protein AB1630_12895 [bacterium]
MKLIGISLISLVLVVIGGIYIYLGAVDAEARRVERKMKMLNLEISKEDALKIMGENKPISSHKFSKKGKDYEVFYFKSRKLASTGNYFVVNGNGLVKEIVSGNYRKKKFNSYLGK